MVKGSVLVQGIEDRLEKNYGKVYGEACAALCLLKIEEERGDIHPVETLDAAKALLDAGVAGATPENKFYVLDWDAWAKKHGLHYHYGSAKDTDQIVVQEWWNPLSGWTHFIVTKPFDFNPLLHSVTMAQGHVRSTRLFRAAA
jgi:hypothetical protein